MTDRVTAVAESGPEALAGAGPYDPFGLWKPPVPKPVVMAVNGIAFTLSIELALASDIVIAADDVRFNQLEIGRGIMPFGGATLRAPVQLGWGNAMRFGTHVQRATEIAQRIAAQAPLGVQATLASARRARAAAEADAIEHLRGALPGILASEDAAEGIRSFLERRPGHFTGR